MDLGGLVGSSEFDFWICPIRTEISWQKQEFTLEDELETFVNLNKKIKAKTILKENLEELILKYENLLRTESLCETNEVLFLKLLSNLSVCHTNANLFKSSVLMKWVNKSSQSDSPKVFLEAWKILQNLRERNSAECSYLEGIYPFIPPWDEKKEPVADIVLVHGINGGASWTWRQHDATRGNPALSQRQRQHLSCCHGDENSSCHGDENSSSCHGDENSSCFTVLDETYSWIWPLDWLSRSIPGRFRIIAVDYPSRWWNWGEPQDEDNLSDFNTLTEEIRHKLKACGVGLRPVVWITHSMGGLIVKKMLQKEASENQYASTGPANLLSSTKALVFLSVPHFGTPLASWSCYLAPLLRPSSLIYHMKAGSPHLKELNNFFVDFCNSRDVAVLSLHETKPSLLTPNGPNLILVPRKYADPKVGEFIEVDSTHMDTCKPRARSDKIFSAVEEFLQKIFKKFSAST